MPEFGTSGLRGLASDLTDELVARYASAFISLHPHNGTIYIGRDRRGSSPRISAAVACGAASQGLEVIDCGVLPTPALADAAMTAGTLSIMVTGSHIPADRNGLKFYKSTGEFEKEDEPPLAEAVLRMELRAGESVFRSTDEPREAFIRRYVSGLPEGSLSETRIGVWLHSSAASEILPQILSLLGAEVVVLGASEDFITVDTEALDDAAREMLRGWVKEHRLDAVVSTDGDADRPLLIDENGEQVPGDILGAITARWLGAQTVVTTISANSMIKTMGDFEHVIQTRIGSPFVIAGMKATDQTRVAGYEPNGGFLLGWDVEREVKRFSRLMTRDSILPLIAVLVEAREENKSVSGLVQDLPSRRTAANRLQNIPREISDSVVEKILGGDVSMLTDELGVPVETDTTDGARVTFGTGEVIHVRPSGNAPELRCYVEAASHEEAQCLLSRALKGLQSLV